MRPDFENRPLLVFWETTKACPLACRHCRANAAPFPLEDELTDEEGIALIRSISDFGSAKPAVVLTGGDCMLRRNLISLIQEARNCAVPVAISPSVSEMLTNSSLKNIAAAGVRSVSVSLDGATPETHESIRGRKGHFSETLSAIRRLNELGFHVQVNTTVMSENIEQLSDIAFILQRLGIRVWEIFFLVSTGRGERLKDLSPEQCEDVCNFLADITRYGFVVRTVEAPFFRRILLQRRILRSEPHDMSGLHSRLTRKMRIKMGSPILSYADVGLPTRDGNGLIFVAHNGDIYPSGFLPYRLGNVRSDNIVQIYRNSAVLKVLRNGKFGGKCGICEYRHICGGSRARAYSVYGDMFAQDPACIYVPSS
ncbi:MAG: TIGR04053 family radical SAM/SPASM domain-containing protein [Methanomassiliicoccales archaeon]